MHTGRIEKKKKKEEMGMGFVGLVTGDCTGVIKISNRRKVVRFPRSPLRSSLFGGRIVRILVHGRRLEINDPTSHCIVGIQLARRRDTVHFESRAVINFQTSLTRMI